MAFASWRSPCRTSATGSHLVLLLSIAALAPGHCLLRRAPNASQGLAHGQTFGIPPAHPNSLGNFAPAPSPVPSSLAPLWMSNAPVYIAAAPGGPAPATVHTLAASAPGPSLPPAPGPSPSVPALVPAASVLPPLPVVRKGAFQRLVMRLRTRGAPSCRQYPQRTCPEKSKLVGPACPSGVSAFGRSSTVANWFYTHAETPSFALDLAFGCPGLRSTLPPSVHYLRADELAADACNYNDGLLPKLPDKFAEDMSGVVVALGVLEQVCDVPSFLEALKTYYRPLIVSYAPVDTKDADVSGRVNALSTAQWRAVLHNLNLDEARHQARVNLNGVTQLMYWFEPADWAPFAT
jgi:hypothetical protein